MLLVESNMIHSKHLLSWQHHYQSNKVINEGDFNAKYAVQATAVLEINHWHNMGQFSTLLNNASTQEEIVESYFK